MAHKNHPIDEALRQWNLARTSFAASLQTYLDAFSHFELACSRIFHSKELDITRPGVRATLDEEIFSLTTHGASVTSTKSKLLQLKNMSMVISSVKILPAEVLAHVFVFAADSYRTVDTGPSRRDLSVEQVNSMSSVCSYWRRIALGTRQLWSFIDFNQLRHADHVSLWLERAGSCPLDVVYINPSELRKMNKDRRSALSLVLPRIQRVRSMVLDSSERLMGKWISGWCSNGAPLTLTTLALRTPIRSVARFPGLGASVNQQRLDELFQSLDTLYLSYVRINWDSLGCHNLVALSLLDLSATKDIIRHILMANPNLQHIHLGCLEITNAPTSTVLPPVQLHSLRTLRLERFYDGDACGLLTMIAPGDCGLTLRMDKTLMSNPSDAARRDFMAFCGRSLIRKLYCYSVEMLRDAIAAESKIEVLVFDRMSLGNFLCNIIAPPLPFSGDFRLPLPHLHSFYASHCFLENPKGFRRLASVYNIREIGIDCCNTEYGSLDSAKDLKDWVGPRINASFVVMQEEKEYAPFDSQ